MGDERKLTEEDRDKIQRLLESGTLENVTLALSLIEETSGQKDIAEIFTMNVIVALICLEDPLVIVRAGSLILKCAKTWKTFADTLANPLVMTSRDYRIRTVDLSKVTAFSQGALAELVNDDYFIDLDGLTTLSDAAAKLLGKHRKPLYLNGLTQLSDASAKSLGKHDGSLFLGGLTELSDASAESLSKHEAPLHLSGLTKLSEGGALQLASHNSLETNAKIKRKIKNAVSSARKQTRESSQTGRCVLTKQQATKIRKLLRTKSPEQAQMAVQLLETSGSTLDDVSEVFSTSILGLIVNTWDVDVWNVLTPLILENPLPRREFIDLVRQRFLTKSGPSIMSFAESIFNRAGVPLAQLLTESALGLGKVWDNWPTPEIAKLSDGGARLILMSGAGRKLTLALTEISDTAAEILSKHAGDLSLSRLTELSDGPGHIMLAEKLILNGSERGRLNHLTKLSDGAAESLVRAKVSYETERQYPVRTLELNGLSELSDAAVESLSQHKSALELCGLSELSDAAVESLSKHVGSLYLCGLKALSDTAAERLSKHEGFLKLSSLTSLTDGPGHNKNFNRVGFHGLFPGGGY